jgi:hypothetical protein
LFSYTEAQSGQTPADYDYAQFIKPKEYLKGVTLGLPWASIWNSILPEADGLTGLLDIVEQLKAAGATIINGTEIANITDGGPLSSYAPENVSYYDSIQYRSDIDMKAGDVVLHVLVSSLDLGQPRRLFVHNHQHQHQKPV